MASNDSTINWDRAMLWFRVFVMFWFTVRFLVEVFMASVSSSFGIQGQPKAKPKNEFHYDYKISEPTVVIASNPMTFHKKSHCKPKHHEQPKPKHCPVPIDCGIIAGHVTQKILSHQPAGCQPKKSFGGYC
ncbi:hypothetical protein BC833DRAFT_662843 [Globomyces pollinis-pini]|nr:hypothetical protein BC833DRAFT_662843 [Globomyces pollinis-pini]